MKDIEEDCEGMPGDALIPDAAGICGVTASDDIDADADLERLRKKHRSEEMREIVDADMKYLKSVFQRLELGGRQIPVGEAAAATSTVDVEA